MFCLFAVFWRAENSETLTLQNHHSPLTLCTFHTIDMSASVALFARLCGSGIVRSPRRAGCISLRRGDAVSLMLESGTGGRELFALPPGASVTMSVYDPSSSSPSSSSGIQPGRVVNDLFRAPFAEFRDISDQWSFRSDGSVSGAPQEFVMPDAFELLSNRPDLAALLHLPCLSLRFRVHLTDGSIHHCYVVVHVHSHRIATEWPGHATPQGIARISRHRTEVKCSSVIHTDFRLLRESPFAAFQPDPSRNALVMTLKIAKQLRNDEQQAEQHGHDDAGYITTKAFRTGRERDVVNSIFEQREFSPENVDTVIRHIKVPRRNNGIVHASWLWNNRGMRDLYRAPWETDVTIGTKFMMMITSQTRKITHDRPRLHSRLFKVVIEETAMAAAPYSSSWFYCFSPQAYASTARVADECPTEISDDEYESSVLNATAPTHQHPPIAAFNPLCHVGYHQAQFPAQAIVPYAAPTHVVAAAAATGSSYIQATIQQAAQEAARMAAEAAATSTQSSYPAPVAAHAPSTPRTAAIEASRAAARAAANAVLAEHQETARLSSTSSPPRKRHGLRPRASTRSSSHPHGVAVAAADASRSSPSPSSSQQLVPLGTSNDTFGFQHEQPHPFNSPLRLTAHFGTGVSGDGANAHLLPTSKRQRLRAHLMKMIEILDEPDESEGPRQPQQPHFSRHPQAYFDATAFDGFASSAAQAMSLLAGPLYSAEAGTAVSRIGSGETHLHQPHQNAEGPGQAALTLASLEEEFLGDL